MYAGQEARIRTGHGTMDWFQIGKGVRQGCILSPCLFNLYAEYIMQNARLDEAQTGVKIAGMLCAGRASPRPAQLLAFAPGKEQAAGVWEP